MHIAQYTNNILVTIVAAVIGSQGVHAFPVTPSPTTLPISRSQQPTTATALRTSMRPRLRIPQGQCFNPYTPNYDERCWATGPSPRSCDQSPYWLSPCAGCRPAPPEVDDMSPSALATGGAEVDNECLLDRLRNVEKNIQFMKSIAYFNLNRIEKQYEENSTIIRLAHNYNVPTKFKCKMGENVREFIMANLATFAMHFEQIYIGENAWMREFADQNDCRHSRATNETRQQISNALCQLQIELGHAPHDACAEGYTGSLTCWAPSESSKSLTRSDYSLNRWGRDRVVQLYFLKFMKKAKKLLRDRIFS